ncbi:hypothetical protein EB796_017924 [Bugula neritina]|uniref:Uncharacterized protein n=1 Tax=Bugula neritina TaxID=10212 RepID=A0A7J7JBW9_BUGNE|nr:hypothetical protein EB796_017924 [Bugula neritina]
MVISNKFPSSSGRIGLVAAMMLAVGVMLSCVPRLGLVKENYKGFRLAKFNRKDTIVVSHLMYQLNKSNVAEYIEQPKVDNSKETNPISKKLEATGQNLLIKGERTVKMFPCPRTIGEKFTCQYYRPAWKNRTDIKNVLEERMTRIKRAWGPLQKAFYDQRKADADSKSTVKINMKGHKKQLNFSVSRSPWMRMVSIYREKCEGRTQCKLGFGKSCASSFTRFVECYIEKSSKEDTEYYGHLDFAYKKCYVCDTPYIYSYVMSFENMAKESEFIFQEAGLRDPVSVMNKVRAESIRDVEKENKKISYLDYWKQVPSELIDKVRFYYRYEIFLFDYPETPFLY